MDEEDQEVFNIFLEEAYELLGSAQEKINTLKLGFKPTVKAELKRLLHTIKGNAKTVQQKKLAEQAAGFEQLVERQQEPTENEITQWQLQLEALKETVDQIKDPTAILETAPSPASEEAEKKKIDISAPVVYLNLNPDVDPQLWAVFLEESLEISEEIQKLFEKWKAAPTQSNFAVTIKRQLHTLKGNARMVSQPLLGEICHSLEELSQQLLKKWDLSYVASMQKGVDWVANSVENLKNGIDSPLDGEWITQMMTISKDLAKNLSPELMLEKVNVVEQEISDINSKPLKESLRVPIEMIEKLADLAGVAAVSRAAIEQRFKQLGVIAFDFMNGLHRLMDHIKQLEQENESNSQKLINAISPQNIDKGVSIDPLQLERYSFFEYLARAFSETANILHASYEMFRTNLNASHEILEQQAQATDELEAKLSQTRMVFFNTVVQRLQRIVRQISTELEKNVELVTENVDTEIDRGVLEKLVPALEHLIRNAVDHGIESAAERKKSNKNPRGVIRLSLSRKGAEFRLVLSDDGAGINTEKVRQLAIEQGLVSADLELTEEEIMPFIMHPGLTTRAVVTQISGRGVGMDVVASEIKALGGSIHIQSKRHEGTVFTIILPLNLTLTQVLLFKLQHDYYAINLASINGVARFYRNQIMQAISDVGVLWYLKEQYQVHYLPEILGYQSFGVDSKEIVPALLLVNKNERFCLVIDQVIGSREIVLKSLGNQLREVPGISGASVLEGGHLVLLLDGPMLYQLIQHNIKQIASIHSNKKFKITTVLVVDDSLTVRRVTQKLLERYEYQVLVAKDGVDALEAMKGRLPDIISTDVEMPRMDGYELVRTIRQDPLLKSIPVIMITSRYGEQHERQAYQAGANAFLSKPFEEKLLISAIQRWLAPLFEEGIGT